MAKRGSKPRPKGERFWEKVNRDGPVIRPSLGPCWVWTAFLTPAGYGFFSVARGRHQLAHRVAWELTHGPTEQWVLHKCDNPRCVNPGHLFEGTNQDNVDDAVQKGRNTKLQGHENGRAKLSEQEARTIKGSAESLSVLARRHGVSKTVISRVKRGASWRHV